MGESNDQFFITKRNGDLKEVSNESLYCLTARDYNHYIFTPEDITNSRVHNPCMRPSIDDRNIGSIV